MPHAHYGFKPQRRRDAEDIKYSAFRPLNSACWPFVSVVLFDCFGGLFFFGKAAGPLSLAIAAGTVRTRRTGRRRGQRHLIVDDAGDELGARRSGQILPPVRDDMA